jgi:hypothetical protein
MYQLNIYMKKFEQALLAAEQQNKLKRVRLKLDPKIREAQDYSQYEGYEGYVLSETETHVEIQIKHQRIMLPKVVLENKLMDFIKGGGRAVADASTALARNAAPGLARGTGNLIKQAKQAKDYYLDPNASRATKFGRIAGKALNVGANVLLNPMYTIKAAERFASAPVRAASSLLGINADNQSKDDVKDFGKQTTFELTSQLTKDIDKALIDTANASNPGHTNAPASSNKLFYYTITDRDNADAKQQYVVIQADVLAQFPGTRSYNKQRIPIGSMPQYANTIQAGIAALKKAPTPGRPTLDQSFFDALQQVNVILKNHIYGISTDKKQDLAIKILHIPSLKEFETGGVLTNKTFKDGFTLSEKYA